MSFDDEASHCYLLIQVILKPQFRVDQNSVKKCRGLWFHRTKYGSKFVGSDFDKLGLHLLLKSSRKILLN